MITWDGKKQERQTPEAKKKNEKWVASGGISTNSTLHSRQMLLPTTAAQLARSRSNISYTCVYRLTETWYIMYANTTPTLLSFNFCHFYWKCLLLFLYTCTCIWGLCKTCSVYNVQTFPSLINCFSKFKLFWQIISLYFNTHIHTHTHTHMHKHY